LGLEHFLSSLGGGGAVLTLSWFVFRRLIEQVDKLSDKIQELDKVIAGRAYKLEAIDKLHDEVWSHKERISALEEHIRHKFA
jgi:uncharacterized coiled-coil protein SlyX